MSHCCALLDCPMKPKSYYEGLLPQPSLELAPIPKRIHQIYIGRSADELAPEMQANIQHLRELNPEWEYRLWDEEAIETFVKEVYGEGVYHYYKMISPNYRAAQSDFVRYLLIYHFGGVYLDVKSTFYKPLDEVLTERDQFILYHWDNEGEGCYKGFGFFKDLPLTKFPYGEYHQGFVIGRAKHPILHAVIAEAMHRLDCYNPFTTGVGLLGVLRTTGPIMYSLTIEEVKRKLPEEQYRHIRSIEVLSGRISIYDDAGAFAHRKKLSNYHNQLAAVSLNGSERYTHYLHYFFYARWAMRVLMDKVNQRLHKG